MMQVAEFIPHHHHDGSVVFCVEDDEDEDEGDGDDDAMCITHAIFVSADTHHGLDLTACLPFAIHVESPDPQPVAEVQGPVDEVLSYTPYYPGPSTLRAPPVSVL